MYRIRKLILCMAIPLAATTVTSCGSDLSDSDSGNASNSTNNKQESRQQKGYLTSETLNDADVLFYDTFEEGQTGTQPQGWDNYLGYIYNTSNTAGSSNYAVIDDSTAHTGSHSIHFRGSETQIVRALPDNTQRLYMRAYVKLSEQMGGGLNNYAYENIMGVKQTQDAYNEVRIGQIQGVLGTNYASSGNIAPTWDHWNSDSKALEPDTWYCVETGLYGDTDYNELHLWVDGELVHSITAPEDWANGPLPANWLSDKFNYVMFGYQNLSASASDVWMDDIVVATAPIGCGTDGGNGDTDDGDTDNGDGDTDNGDGDTDNGDGDTDNGGGDTDNGDGDTDNGDGDTDNGDGDTDNGDGDTDNGDGDTDNGDGDTDNGGGDTDNGGGDDDTGNGDGGTDDGNTGGDTHTPDAANGSTLYTSSCVGCHGEEGQGRIAIDASKAVFGDDAQTLTNYISANMPPRNASACDDDCASDIAAFIQTWPADTDGDDGDTGNGDGDDEPHTPDAANGNTLYTSTCVGCHGEEGQGRITIDASKTVFGDDDQALKDYIAARMPSYNPALCDEDCATDIAAYIQTWPADDEDDDAPTGVLFSESFENNAINSQPNGWDNLLSYVHNASNSKTSNVYALVDDSQAYSGSQAMHFRGGMTQIVRALPENTDHIYMRAFVRMDKQMGGVAGDNHEHIMGVKSTMDANNEIRIGQIKGVLGTNEVPTDNIAPTSDEWYAGKAMQANQWYCVETELNADADYDTLNMWVDGELVHSITSDSDWNNGAMGPDWMADKFNYVMFGFHSFSANTPQVWMDDIVVSTEAIGCDPLVTDDDDDDGDTDNGDGDSGNGDGDTDNGDGDSGNGDGDTDNGDGDSGNGDGDTDNDNADAYNGETLYDSMCAGCHGADGSGPVAIDADKHIFGDNQSLTDYIATSMPIGNAAACDADCAADIAAYIDAWDDNDDTGEAGDISYGPRLLRVLTEEEFTNSIEDLTGINIADTFGNATLDAIPADSIVGGFANNTMANIDSGALQSYELVVDKLVDYLAENDFAPAIDCTQFDTGAICAAYVIESYLPKVFRRPLTDDELETYQELLASDYSGGDAHESMALILRTAFTSPQFLYRDETGVSVADLESGTGADSEYEQSGDIQTLIDSSEPATLSIYNQKGSNASFSGDDLVVITLKATKGAENGLWPTLAMQSNNVEIARMEITHTYDKTYTFHVTELSGNGYFAVINQQTGAPDEYKGGHDLIISRLEVSPAVKKEVVLPEEELDDDAYVLTQYQLASYLAFTYTGSTPDDELLQAAARDELQTDEQIANQVERLLHTDRARDHFGDFAAQWLRTDRVLNITKDTELYPGFTPEVRKAMAEEVRDVFNHVVLDEQEPFTAMYDGSFTFANQVLADFYGFGGVTGDSMQKVTNLTDRAGLVTSGAFLAVHAHEQETGPILRAAYFRRQFLCQYVPAPPTGVAIDGTDFDAMREEARVEWEAYLEEHDGKATARRKYAFQTSSSSCQTCHAEMINPLGFGFEDFDAVGMPQAVDYNGLPVDASGTLFGVTATDDGDAITFDGAKDLAHSIAGLDTTRQCFVDTAFRLAMGTAPTWLDRTMTIELSADEIANYTRETDELDQKMVESGNSTIELLKALGTMDSVRYRKNVERN